MGGGPSSGESLLRVKGKAPRRLDWSALSVMSKYPTAGYHRVTILSRPSTVKIIRKFTVESRKVRTLNWLPKASKCLKKPRFALFLEGPEWVKEDSNRNKRLSRAPFKHRRGAAPRKSKAYAERPASHLVALPVAFAFASLCKFETFFLFGCRTRAIS
jgi:hypothetical protein